MGSFVTNQNGILARLAKIKNTGVSLPQEKFSRGQNCQKRFCSPHNVNDVVELTDYSYTFLL
jgi:peroxiredoxin